jgi:hypothetical protein
VFNTMIISGFAEEHRTLLKKYVDSIGDWLDNNYATEALAVEFNEFFITLPGDLALELYNRMTAGGACERTIHNLKILYGTEMARKILRCFDVELPADSALTPRLPAAKYITDKNGTKIRVD